PQGSTTARPWLDEGGGAGMSAPLHLVPAVDTFLTQSPPHPLTCAAGAALAAPASAPWSAGGDTLPSIPQSYGASSTPRDHLMGDGVRLAAELARGQPA